MSKNHRFLYWIEIDPDLTKVGITNNLPRRAKQIRYKCQKDVSVIKCLKMPYMCARCAEFSICWNFEYVKTKHLPNGFMSKAFDHIEDLIPNLKCRRMNQKKYGNIRSVYQNCFKIRHSCDWEERGLFK